MKRRLWILLLVCAGLMAVSCQNKTKKNTPAAVTEAFVKAFFTADFTHQYQYSTKKSDILIQQAQNGIKDNAERLEKMKNTKVEFVSTSVDDMTDSACTCTCKVILDGQPRQDKWDLVKENGEWKVSLVIP